MFWLVDTQLPPSSKKILISLIQDAIHTTDFHEGHLYTDFSIRKIAIELNRIIISKDWDFFDDYFLLGSPPKVVHLQIGNCTNKELFFIWEKNQNQIIELLNSGSELVVLSKNEIISY